MVIYADRQEITGWGGFWVGVFQGKLVFLERASGNSYLSLPGEKQESSLGLEQFAERCGLSVALNSTGETQLVWGQLRQYLGGTRKQFDLPIQLFGTEFQVRVWQKLLDIPWGVVRTYGEIGLSLGNSGLARAIGQANSRNPISIVVPCHRVVAMNGLGGYTGGLDLKKRLLRLEGVL